MNSLLTGDSLHVADGLARMLPLAQFDGWSNTGIAGIVFVVVLVALLVLLVSWFVQNFKRCPSNQVLVIYGKWTGKGGAARTVHGGASFVLPLVQNYSYLSLEPIQIEIPLRGALSSENIRVNVPSVFTVAVGTEPAVMQQAAIRLLTLSTQEIRKQAEEIIFGQLRQVIASMGIEEINRDRDTFLQHIQQSLEPELSKIGLVLINVNITDITDESGYIDAIGQKAATEAIQQARGDVADNEKMGEIRVSTAERDKSVQVAGARRDQSIGVREAQRDQAIRVAELEKEQTIGEQSAMYQREAAVKDAEREKRIRVADADALAIDGENEAQAKIAESQAELLVKRAEAYQLGEGRKKEAEAKVLEIQNRAMAQAALAEAERIEAEQRAKLEASAKAEKAKMIVDAEAEAEKRRLEAGGEADAIFAKLDAEARGQYEILAKKGEGLRAIVDACGGSKEAFQMMLLEHLDHLADASAAAISNIKFDKVVVWENGANGDGRNGTAGFLNGMAKTLPPMLQVMKDIGGVELPESLIKLMEEHPAAEDNGRTVDMAEDKKPEPVATEA
jgi:flotillin